MRSPIPEHRRTTQDGRIWPVERHRMQSAAQIRERMLEDIAALARIDGEFASLSYDDLARQGWTPEQVRAHGSAAFNVFNARQRAAEKAAAGKREYRSRDSGARMAIDAAALALFTAPVLIWAGRFTGAL